MGLNLRLWKGHGVRVIFCGNRIVSGGVNGGIFGCCSCKTILVLHQGWPAGSHSSTGEDWSGLLFQKQNFPTMHKLSLFLQLYLLVRFVCFFPLFDYQKQIEHTCTQCQLLTCKRFRHLQIHWSGRTLWPLTGEVNNTNYLNTNYLLTC